MADLTPVATEQQLLRNYHDQREIDVLTAAAFATAGIPACGCGRMTDGVVATCWPCQSGNTRGGFYCPAEERSAIYGQPAESEATCGAAVSVTGDYAYQPAPVGPGERRLWADLATAQEARITALEAENSALAARVIELSGRAWEARGRGAE